MQNQIVIEELVQKVLDGMELRLKIDSYDMNENFETGVVTIRCNVHHARTGEHHVIEGSGVGMIDALFNGTVKLYADQFPSLKSIRFAHFGVKANFDSSRANSRSDFSTEVTLAVANSHDREYTFHANSPSITRAFLAVVLEGVAFFINCERAFIAVYNALKHAKQSNRPDSIELYTGYLTTLVEATSYSEVIEQLKPAE